MLLEINTGEMKLKFTAFAFMYSKPGCVFINYRNLISLTCFSQHILYVEDTAKCGREYRGK